MAKIEQNTMLLFLKEVEAADWQGVVCLTSHGFSFSRSTNDASTFCGPDSVPGDSTASVSIAGQTFLMPETNQVSAPKLLDWSQNGTTLEWEQRVAVPQTGDWVKSGQGYISDFADTYDQNAPGTFTATLTVKGDVDQYLVGESI